MTPATAQQQEQDYDYDSWAVDGDVESYNKAYELPPVNEMYTWELVKKGPDVPQAPQYNPTGKKLRSQFTFQIVDDPDWEGFELRQYINLSLNEKSHLRPFVEAMLGRPLGAKEKVAWRDNPDTNTTGIGNLRFRAILKEDKKEDGRVFGKIESPLPLKSPRQTAPQAARQTPEETGDAPF